jgi:hypothetical protein
VVVPLVGLHQGSINKSEQGEIDVEDQADKKLNRIES